MKQSNTGGSEHGTFDLQDAGLAGIDGQPEETEMQEQLEPNADHVDFLVPPLQGGEVLPRFNITLLRENYTMRQPLQQRPIGLAISARDGATIEMVIRAGARRLHRAHRRITMVENTQQLGPDTVIHRDAIRSLRVMPWCEYT